MKHTPTPWHFTRNVVATHAKNYVVAQEGERKVLIFEAEDSYWSRPHNTVSSNAEANAKRIVECVNAMERVERPELVRDFLLGLERQFSNDKEVAGADLVAFVSNALLEMGLLK